MSARATVVGAAATIAVIAVAGAAFALAAPRASAPEGYRAYLNARDGIEVLTTVPAAPGGPFTVSQATSGLIRALSGIPSRAAAGAVASEATAYGDDVTVLRSYTSGVTADGSISSGYSTYLASPDGLLLVVERVGTTDLWYDPPIPVLPANPQPGDSWSVEGAVSGVATYTADGRVEASDEDGCIRTVTHSTVEFNGEVVRSLGQDSTWCLGRGSTTATDVDSDLVVALADPPIPAPALAVAPAPTALSGPSSVGLLAATVRHTPQVSGGGVVLVNSTSADVLLAGTTADEEGLLPITWLQHPGGEILGVGADEAGPIVATSERQLIALDRAGRWRWTLDLADAVAGDPVVVGDTVVVALLDGSVVGVDGGSGATQWTQRMSDGVVASPRLAGARIVVADIAGEVTAFDADGETGWSTSTAAVLRPLTVLADGSVLVVDRDGIGTLLDPDGDERWSVRVDGDVTSAGASARDVVVLPTSAGPLALRVDDGSPAWTAGAWPRAAIWATPAGDTVLATIDGRAAHLAADGIVLADRDVSEPDGAPADGQQVIWIGGLPVSVTSSGSLLPLDDVVRSS